MQEKQDSFENSFTRLEEILKLLNEGKISLEDSLKLFEEADSLITSSHIKLQSAEKKIEKLIKNRDDLLELDNQGIPKKEEFTPSSNEVL